MNATQIEFLFDRCFAARWRTVLRGGASEPLYTPPSGGAPARIDYREDYVASALHEVAHWCIAGPARRGVLDYGYWYAPDGRSAIEQQAFERVEARPQAVEWVFSQSCGVGFSLSLDNLAGAIDPGSRARFAAAVVLEAETLQSRGLPKRARSFAAALCAFDAAGSEPHEMIFSLPTLLPAAA